MKKNKILILIMAILLGVFYYYKDDIYKYTYSLINNPVSYDIDNIPDYNGNSYVIVNDNNPYFKEEDYTTTSYEEYSKLDYLGRCGPAIANISTDLMPT